MKFLTSDVIQQILILTSQTLRIAIIGFDFQDSNSTIFLYKLMFIF